MCGRFALFRGMDPLVDDLDAIDLTGGSVPPRWNTAPTVPVAVVTESVDRASGEVLRALRVARWGLLPPFAKDLSFSAHTFNARLETLDRKPSFRGQLARYRALIPMDGYYEWRRCEDDRTKQPFFITPADGTPLYMAALVAWWRGDGGHSGPAASPDGAWLLSASIITRAAAGGLAEIHDRTPVMLRRAAVDAWLDPQLSSSREVMAFLHEEAHLLPDAALELRPVGPAVGNVRVDGPELIARV
ncbi:SOS response-associated peptidase [Brachybacterium hainanense]|uniref:Abasic site processing protein n=1 Tax=Brachybacterium hainanense TaxID=1541174 RepID=A0ABV6RBZ6_9MICO